MKTKLTILIYPIFVLVVILASSCSKESAKEAPIVRTSEVSKITESSAYCGGIVTLEGDAPVFERGLCWDTIPSINEISSSHKKIGEGFGNFEGYFSPLRDGAKYYVKAYAINNYGTGYGEVKTFTTLLKEVDARDQIIGVWQFNESSKNTIGQSYIVTISKHLTNKDLVILHNFGNPGSQSFEVNGTYASGQIIVLSQTMANGWKINGLGKIVDVDNTSMTWTYSITAGGDPDDYQATATKQ